jgi:hypothetical protein
MGTSASVSGAGPGVPLVPDWVEDVPADDASSNEPESATDTDQVAPQQIPLASKARLASARREMGKFAMDGERSHLRRGVANYIRSGRGGTAMATRRSAGSASRGASLAGIVGGSSAFDVVRDRIRDAIASSGDPDLLLAAIAAAASPNDGTLDSETGQRAAAEALQHVLELNPDADLLNLGQSDRETLLERFLAIDCYELFMGEVGKHIQSKVDLATAAERIDGIKDYFCETFRQTNRTRRENGSRSLGSASDQQIAAVCRAVVAEAYFTFEVYLDEN